MEGEQSLLEVFVVSVSVGSSLEGADLVVDSFEGSGRERFVVPVEQSGAVGLEGLAQCVRCQRFAPGTQSTSA